MPKLRVTIIDEVRNRRLKVDLPDDAAMEKLLPALARKLGLPPTDYRLTHEATGQALGGDQTLASFGVREGETLRLAAAREEAPVVPEPAVEAKPVEMVEEEAVSIWQKVPIWAWGAIGGVVLLIALAGAFLAGREATPTPTAVAEVTTPTATPAAMPQPTATSVVPTSTPVPPTATPVPPTDTPVPTSTPQPTATPVPPTDTPLPAATSVLTPFARKFRVGMVSDVSGIDDARFNENTWKGCQDAVEQLGVEGKYLESQQQADYTKNIHQFVDEELDLIITVGFLLGVDTATAAMENPDQKFAIVDYAYPDCWPGAVPGKDCGSEEVIDNVLGLIFATDEAAFMAGYLAAGMTQTGKVGCFGGIKIPTVTIFMRGMEAGVKYYNEQHGTSVELLGWDTAADEGLFTGNFESTDDGRRFAESLMDEGADIIMPVAGPVGLGSAAACQERGTMLIGVDTDWYISAPEFKETYLTSVLKNMDVVTFNAVQMVVEDRFGGGAWVGVLANEGVGIAPFHDFEGKVPGEIKADLEQIRQGIINGTIETGWD